MSIRGTDHQVPLEFVRLQPYVTPKIELSDQRLEKVDFRVLPAIFRFKPPAGFEVPRGDGRRLHRGLGQRPARRPWGGGRERAGPWRDLDGGVLLAVARGAPLVGPDYIRPDVPGADTAEGPGPRRPSTPKGEAQAFEQDRRSPPPGGTCSESEVDAFIEQAEAGSRTPQASQATLRQSEDLLRPGTECSSPRWVAASAPAGRRPTCGPWDRRFPIRCSTSSPCRPVSAIAGHLGRAAEAGRRSCGPRSTPSATTSWGPDSSCGQRGEHRHRPGWPTGRRLLRRRT